MQYYFAYGSNLHHAQMKRRCPNCRYIKKHILNGFQLTFRSKYRAADIEAKKKGIQLSDQSLKEIILNDKSFHNNGKFSLTKYEKFLLEKGDKVLAYLNLGFIQNSEEDLVPYYSFVTPNGLIVEPRPAWRTRR